jgi:hypothetical protein
MPTKAEYIKKIPYLKPGTHTALRALRHLQKIIRQEPERLDMSWYLIKFAGRTLGGCLFGQSGTSNNPACGTVGCAAGWLIFLSRPTRLPKGHYEDRALESLGLGRRKKNFWGNNLSYHSQAAAHAGRDLRSLFVQTTWTPSQVVTELDRIIKDHRSVLTKSKFVAR